MKQTTNGTSPSTDEMKAAIRETRDRLDMQLARTRDHVHDLLTSPPLGHILRRTAIAGINVVLASVLAGKTRRR